MERLEQDYGKRNFKILLVNVGESEKVVRNFMRKGNYSFTALLDINGSVNNAYVVFGHPAAFLIDKNGKIVIRSMGYRDWNTKKMRATYDSLLME